MEEALGIMVMTRFLSLAAVLFFAVFLGACSSLPPVQSGRRGLLDATVGTRANAAVKGDDGSVGAPVDASSDVRASATGRKVARVELLGLKWPLGRIQVTSPFGWRGRDFHEGVDLRAGTGTPIFAAQSGVVLYASRSIKGYGRMVILKHPSGYATVYAHNSKLLVRSGQKVKQGQKIALSGSSGRSKGPHLHFEVRDGVVPLDPTEFLPEVALAAMPDGGHPAVRGAAAVSVAQTTD